MAPVTVVPSVLVMVTDLASILAMTPRTSIGTAGGASAANAVPAASAKTEPRTSERIVMSVSPILGGNAHQFAPTRKDSAFSLPCSGRALGACLEHDLDPSVARLLLAVACRDSEMGFAKSLSRNALRR